MAAALVMAEAEAAEIANGDLKADSIHISRLPLKGHPLEAPLLQACHPSAYELTPLRHRTLLSPQSMGLRFNIPLSVPPHQRSGGSET